MRTVFDHLNRPVVLPERPERIISLVPSITETLFALGLQGRLVGRTRYCILPPEAKEVPIVGGTKDATAEKILSKSPDCIIAEKEETPKELVERLKQEAPVYVTNVESFEDGLRLIRDLGDITDQREKAEEILTAIRKEYTLYYEERDRIRSHAVKKGRKGDVLSVAYFIWRKPYMVAGSSTFIDAMLNQLGLLNLFAGRERYPIVTAEEIRRKSPDLLFLSSEPFPFSQKHEAEFKRILPSARIIFVDGAVFSWYGVRMISAPSYFKSLLHEMIDSL